MADASVFGLKPNWASRVSVLLHAINAVAVISAAHKRLVSVEVLRGWSVLPLLP